MFQTLLVANRGEIACRIMRTCREMDIRTIAVFTEADRQAWHVTLADQAYPIDSYLDSEAILRVAGESGAQAVHPGYGFLAENEAFAAACAAADVVFVGPPVEALRSMGSKVAAKGVMEQAGVPVVPGYYGEDQSVECFLRESAAIGFPVLLKASAGGGGKGMRRVDRPEELEAALEAARRESSKAFGDDRMLVEKFVSSPRHIEIQIFADHHGNTVHMFERECSIQRRYQKVVEESPAPGMTPELRELMGQAAVDAARAVGYANAGTVEFILDADGAFYFMEMNTRLQVEHPVTEMVTGADLVSWQIEVAWGSEFPMTQEDLEQFGHAIEVRIYAEDPQRDFLPATGQLHHLRWPETSEHVRIDTGVREGDAVTIDFDPMLAKLIVWDHDREGALARLRGALAGCQVAGLTTNLSFLRALATHDDFIGGQIDTGFIARHLSQLVLAASVPDERVQALGALAVLRAAASCQSEAQAVTADPHSPWVAAEGFRINGQAELLVPFDCGTVRVAILGPGCYRMGSLEVRGALTGRLIEATIDGLPVSARAMRVGQELTVFCEGSTSRLEIRDPLQLIDQSQEVGGGRLTAPMPGKVIQVMVESGAIVQQGDPLLVLEAMKMEQTILAPADGEVSEVHYAVGDQVEEGAILVAFLAGS